MTALESPHYQIARDQIKGNPVITKMAAGVATVPLAELAHEDGTPRFAFMQHASRAFDHAEAQNSGNPRYLPYPADAPRHLGLIAEAVLAERAAIRAAVASAMATPGTSPESADVTRIIKQLRAGESPVAIARETGAIR
jgi:DNA-binding NtrC family response regulator